MLKPHAPVLILLAAPAVAQDDFVMYLDTPEACAVTQDMDVEERPMAAMHDGGAMVLRAWGMDAIEYYCEFETEIEFDFAETSLQTRAGFCAEPGEYIYPQVFVIGMSEGNPDQVHVWSSENPSGEATIYTACRQN